MTGNLRTNVSMARKVRGVHRMKCREEPAVCWSCPIYRSEWWLWGQIYV